MSLFLQRCNSMLHHVNYLGRIPSYSVQEDEFPVICQLMRDRKISEKRDQEGELCYFSVAAKPYSQNEDCRVHPLVLELASENEHLENMVRLFRKNVMLLTNGQGYVTITSTQEEISE